MAGGTLAVPNDFAAATGNVPASQIDSDFSTVETYVNIRQIESGTLAARPAAGTKGQWYFASDTSGGTLYFDTGTAWVQAAQQITTSRRLTSQLTATGTDANTSEKVLQTYTVAASQLAIAGDSVIARALFTAAANANTKNVRIRVGTTTLTGTVLIGGDAIALNNGSILLEVEIIRSAVASQIAWGRRWANDAAIYTSVAGYTGLGLTLSSTFLIEATGENGTAAANDIVCRSLTVDFMTG